MPYQIIRNNNGWVQNEEGQVLVRDVDNQLDMWVDNNIIYFNQQNNPCFKVLDENETQDTEQVLSFFNIETPGECQQNLMELDEENVDIASTSGENINSIRSIWSHESTLALIVSVESRYDDLFHIHKKKTFWNVVHEELLSQGFNFAPKTCQKKWENLYRTYKSSKDLKTKTGRGPTRFKYYDKMDEILGDTPTNSSPHSLDVHRIEERCSDVEQQSENLNSDGTLSESSNSKGKRRNPTTEYIQVKKKYFEQKQQEYLKKVEVKTKYLEEMVNLKKEQNDLMKKKLELEERKVTALEKLVINSN